MDAKSRLSCILQDLDVKAPTLAKSLDGVSYQNLLDVQTGRVKSISNKVATAIVTKYPQYNLKWLLTGEGEMLKDPAPSETPEPKTPGFWQRIIDNLLAQVCQKDEIIAQRDKTIADLRQRIENMKYNE